MSLMRAASKGYEPPFPDETSGVWDRGITPFTWEGDDITGGLSITGFDDLLASDTVYVLYVCDTNAIGSCTLEGESMTSVYNSGDNSPRTQLYSITGIVGASSLTLSASVTSACCFIAFCVDLGWTLSNSEWFNGSSGMPNPPSITGVATDDTFVTIGALDDDEVTATAPSGYTLYAVESTIVTGGTARCSAAMTADDGLSGTVNAGAYGGAGSDFWWAGSLIFSPV